MGLAPPCPRGWTRVLSDGGHLLVGSPACAGMDPRLGGNRRTVPRLPRVRGDGPQFLVDPSIVEMAPRVERGLDERELRGRDRLGPAEIVEHLAPPGPGSTLHRVRASSVTRGSFTRSTRKVSARSTG